MTLTIDLSSEEAAAARAKAQAEGLSVERWLKKLVREQAGAEGAPPKRKKSALGLLAKYGPAPSAEEIDENRREMFRGFAEDAG